MKPEFVASFLAALVLHALVLFVVRVGSPAKPLALSDDPSSVDVSLVEGDPAPAPAAEPPAPEPEMPPAPQPTPDMSTPPPIPVPAPEETMTTATPAPQSPQEKPKPHTQEQRHPRKSTAAASGTPSLNTAGSNSAAPIHGGAGSGNGPVGSHARYRSNPKPEYPPESLQRHEEGLVILGVDVSTDGRPSNVTLKRSSGYPLLDQAAITGVRRWTFDPARAAGIPVSSHVDVPVRFSLSDYGR